MANLYRIIFAVFSIAFFVAGPSFAAIPLTTTYGFGLSSCTHLNRGGFSTPQAACAAAGVAGVECGNAGGANGYTLVSTAVTSPTSCSYTYTGPSSGTGPAQLISTPGACPANSSLSGSECVCNVGFTQSGSTCIVPVVNNCPSAGTSAGRWSRPHISGNGLSDPYYICDAATPSGSNDGSLCVVSVVGDIGVGEAGVMVIYGEASFTGSASATCNGSGGQGTSPGSGNANPPVQGQPAPTPCKAGYAPGTVNGLTSCYPAGATGKPVTTPSTSTGSTSVDGNSPTATGTTSTTECLLGRCTTTTTSTSTKDGVTSSTTSTKEESQGDFCKENPKSMQCVTSSFGGSCAASFVCDGDAVMCAITKEQHIRNCKLFDDTSSAEAQLYGTEKNKTGSQTADLPGNQSLTINASSFDTTDAFGVAPGCIADRSITVAGAVVSIPFSSVCSHLAMFGNLLLSVAFLLAGRIVFRG